MPRTVLAGALLLAALGAASPARAAPDFKPTGEVILVGLGPGFGASFDAERVVGPNVNLTRRGEDAWAGDIAGLDVDLSVQGGHITGPNVDLHVARQGERTEIRGLLRGKVVRLEVDAKKVSGRSGVCSLELRRDQAGDYEGDLGCVGRRSALPATGRSFLRVQGDAATPERRPFPQFALALVAIIPG
ncbi:hypothetical protein [Anaeromyxobacter paludicola]|uniref:Uncharacterized protein n=1 Tax=Anaeromyxobacter paludicola TaxID=2918171 RepID=A0ABM7X676_9BACT|nr:hypothetical protein [Anaeromyxobacter paludicola]BDG07324.1 hypothetical protein AMPC_04370 [Anaeromyxobacter paludicola]